ncbi:Gp138 family membrane-puncturing spike protein [Bartonella tamiae]|uniref:Phage protein Gp138 N-terminal domain-containing protein n=1 Tax=Bartonella tamiae Th239 TaxID=1094558 RepID=J0QTA8_9HYPH|nr:Gp138 family membrane-puncturing spike protein [Bartonella tamiae]EJF89121.1 hypothetical protein ME5_01672 [Bartonella tamiae Th239]EJF95476.1 hypothetical protein MEG_00209 [Bartonella tamiae Th307]
MTYKNTKPSIDPADNGSLEGLLRHAMKKQAQNTDGMMPARVIDYDRKTNRVKIQPLAKIQGTDGQTLSRAPIASIPAYRFGNNGALISFPIQKGDLGWVMAGDRDISLIEQSGYDEQPPNTNRFHSFSNGMFFPDSLKEWAIDDEDLDNTVIGTTDGEVKISFGKGEMKIVSAQKITIEAPKTEIIGDLKVQGRLEAQGGIYGMNGLSFERHRHEKVKAGNEYSGKPNGESA